jgi:phosphoheptose isomerase
MPDKSNNLNNSQVIGRFLSYQKQFENALLSIKNPEFLLQFQIAVELSVQTLKSKKGIAVAGNGGSHADAMHISAELVNQFMYTHEPLPVIALGTNQSVLTSWSNDKSFENQFSREMLAYKDLIGLVICITTSGKSKNILELIAVAKKNKIKVIALTSEPASKYLSECDVILGVGSTVTSNIQEIHSIIYHALCSEIERAFTSDALPSE